MKAVILILSAVLLSACEQSVTTQKNGSVLISDGGNQAAVYVIEKDGYTFAVAMSNQGSCSITQVDTKLKLAERP